MITWKSFTFYYLWNFCVNRLPSNSVKCRFLRMFAHVHPTVRLGHNITIAFPRNVTLGENVTLHDKVHLGAKAPITIGNGSVIRRNTIIGTGANTIAKSDLPRRKNPVTIGDNVDVGEACVIISGSHAVSIGDDCVIYAGSVVLHPIPAGYIAGGNRVRLLGKVSS